MLWFQTRYSKSSFLFPFLYRVWVFVSSHYWFGLISFPLKGSQRSTDSHLFSISHSSPCSIRLSSSPRMWNISSVTGILRQSLLTRSPLGPGETREERHKKYNRLYLLYSGTSALIRPERKEAPMTFQMMSGSSESSLVDYFFIQMPWLLGVAPS